MTTREIHIGIVRDNADPEQRGRLMVECATLAADGALWPDWIEPVFSFLSSLDTETSNGGGLWIPDVGVAVELEIATASQRDESPGAVSVDAPDIRWRACVFARGKDVLGSEFVGDNYPNRRGWQTRSGHALIFDDTDGDPEVKLQQVNEFGISFFDFDETGSAFISTSKGQLFYMNQDAGEVTLLDTNSNLLTFNADGWFITSADSDMVKAGGGEISLFSGNILLNASGVNANVGGFSVAQLGLDTPVIVEGLAGFSTMFAAFLTELKTALLVPAAVGTPPMPASPMLDALNSALGSGSFTATLLTSE